MRIGVDATCWANSRGYGRFTREMIPVMAARAPDDRFICFLDRTAAERFEAQPANVEARIVQLAASPTTAAAASGSRSLLDLLRMTRAVSREPLDVFFSPTVYTYFPLPPSLRSVVTVHDAIVERFPALTLPGWRARWFWRMKVALALRQARVVLTVSDFAAADIARGFGISPDRIRVSGEAPASEYTLPTDPCGIARMAATCGVPDRATWFVYVGGFNPHKNVDVLVHAHAVLARERGADAPHLLLVGTTDGDVFYGNRAAIEQAIEDEGTASLVHWTGFLPDDQLRSIHAGALALVLPSACEGFGLPAVEAAACGTPVVATRESPLPQLLAGGGLFVQPGQVGALVDALRVMATDRSAREMMGRQARARSRTLTWQQAADAALAALREAA
jgi:glycosyltransferase involved in cell wall biosynthesis